MKNGANGMFKVCFDYTDDIDWRNNIVGTTNTYDEAFAIANDFIRNELNVKPPYFRVWGDFDSESGLTIDYGSHTAFVKVINDEGC